MPAAASGSTSTPPDAPYKVESGPANAPEADFRHNDVPMKADKAGVIRIVRGLNPYEWDPGLFNQWSYNPDDGRLYAYFMDTTLVFDPKTSAWADMKVPKFSQSRNSWLLYGTLACDPINKEFVSIGGTSDQDGGTPGTWTFRLANKDWEKLSPGSRELRELNSEARALCTGMAGFINACRSRFYVTESEAEARKDLAAGASDVVAATDKLVAKLNLAKLAGAEASARGAALAALVKVSTGLKTMAGKLGGELAGETLVEAQSLLDAAERAERMLDSEPCGRAAAPAVTCCGKGKIVLFGGCRMDGYLADTWVYDPATREWEYPPVWGNVGGTKADMKGTPKGVVYWDGSGNLQLYDARNRDWSKLPIKGEKLGAAYGDTGGICYDSKRDCLWPAHNGSPMMRYDMKTGELTRDSSTGAPVNIYMRGTAYIPELDMLLNVGRVNGPEGQAGNLVYDIENKKWIGIQLPCGDGQPRINDKPYSSISLSLDYDPGLKIAVFHANNQEILVSRIDKASLKTFEAKIAAPRK